MSNNQKGYKISWVKVARKRLGITQCELGARLNVSTVTVNRWENGKRSPTLATLEKLALLMGIKPSELLEMAESDYVGD